MLQNYFIVAIRHLLKDKTKSIINLTCLSVGMAAAILIAVYIKDELSFNLFNKNYNNIYRAEIRITNNGEPRLSAGSPFILRPYLLQFAPEGLEASARLYQRSGAMEVSASDSLSSRKFQEQGLLFADQEILRIFSIEFLSGHPTTALRELNSVVLTEEMARKYFDTTDVVGKTLLFENKLPLKITAVVKAMPNNSDLRFDFLASFESYAQVENEGIAHYLKNDWIFSPAINFMLLKKGTDPKVIEAQLNNIVKQHGDARSKELVTFNLRPLAHLHLNAADVDGSSSNSMVYIYIFALIAFLILLIANVNFVNLATARASLRSKEVGIRKVLGASKKQIVWQFLSETIVLCGAAFFVSLFIAHLLLPTLNQLTGKELSEADLFTVPNVLAFFVLLLSVGVLAGLYPAFFVTRFKIVNTLKGNSGELNTRNGLRKILLVTQFSVSLVLIVCAILIYQQLQFLRSKPLGFQKEQMIAMPIFGSGASILAYGVDGPMRQRMNAFCNELKKNKNIADITAASELPGQGFIPGLVIPQGKSEDDNNFMPWVSVDYNFLSVFKIPILAGRSFSKELGTDHLNAFIINESALGIIECKTAQEAIGKDLIRGDALNGKRGKIIGVIKDFNFNTLDRPAQPAVLDVSAMRFTQFAISLHNGDVPETLAFIEKTWQTFFPERIFEYSFLEDDIANLYRSQENMARMISYFALIAILLSCLGLFSLSAFLTQRRTKEIGIRKVLGASSKRIVFLLVKDFLKLSGIAILIASPIAWKIMSAWLENYAYRILISPWVFVTAGFFLLLVTLLTVSVHCFKTAVSNPVKSLRFD